MTSSTDIGIVALCRSEKQQTQVVRDFHYLGDRKPKQKPITTYRDGSSMIWWGRGGCLLCQLWCRVNCVGHVRRLDYCKILLDHCIWIVIVVHSSLIIKLLLKLLYLILSLIFFALSWKIAPFPLCTPSGQSYVCVTPPVNPSLTTYLWFFNVGIFNERQERVELRWIIF